MAGQAPGEGQLPFGQIRSLQGPHAAFHAVPQEEPERQQRVSGGIESLFEMPHGQGPDAARRHAQAWV